MDETAEADTGTIGGERSKYSLKRLCTRAILIILVVIFILGPSIYSKILFDNDRNFKFLSNLEREMSLRTEMGFYYSYYKTLAEDNPFSVGLSKIMYDKTVEYPSEINGFNRFNIHPELIMAALYRYFEPWLNTSEHVECHMVERREGLEPVESCWGLGVPMLFYLEAVWLLAGVAVAAVFLQATLISESIVGGILATCQYFANHSEATRVHFAPNERENFAWPLLMLQAWLVCIQLKDKHKKMTIQLKLGIFFLNCLSLTFWQFSQFILLTQTFIFFIMEQLCIIDAKTLSIFLHAHFCGLHLAVLLLQGNDMLKTSLYTSFFIAVSAYSLFFNNLRIKVVNRVDLFVEAWLVLLRLGIIFITSIYIKKIISQFLGSQEDSHIWDLLFAKFSSGYANFHTLMYTCSAVYDFLPMETVIGLTKSTLIPVVIVNVILVLNRWLRNGLTKDKIEVKEVPLKEAQEDEDSGIENNSETKLRKRKKFKTIDLDVLDKMVDEKEEVVKDNWLEFLRRLKVEPDVFYCIAQLCVYGVMAALIMRLKLMFVSQLCVASSLIANSKYQIFRKAKNGLMRFMPPFWVLLIFPLAYSLTTNMTKELMYINEFEDASLEELLLWIRNASGVGAFAGSLPTMAAVLLSTRRPVVVHPHYEHYDTRERAYRVYKVYGQFPSLELYEDLTKLKASYMVVEKHYCYGKSDRNCSFHKIWAQERPDLRGQPLLCHLLETERVDHFYPVFRNDRYTVFRVHDVSVEYMPRSFDT